jgi:hypothetical protein
VSGGLATPGGGLTVCSCIAREPALISLDRFSGKDLVGKSSSNGCSRSARPPRTSQATAGTLEERIRAKEIKMKGNDKILVDAIGRASIDRESFII